MKKNKRLSHWARFCKLVAEHVTYPKRVSAARKALQSLEKAGVWQGPVKPGGTLDAELHQFYCAYILITYELQKSRRERKSREQPVKPPATMYSALVEKWGAEACTLYYVNSSVLCKCATPGTCDCSVSVYGYRHVGKFKCTTARARLELVIPKRYYLLRDVVNGQRIQLAMNRVDDDKTLAKTVYCVESYDGRRLGYVQVSLNDFCTAKFCTTYEDLERKKKRTSAVRRKYLKLANILAWKRGNKPYKVLVKPKKHWCDTWECVIDAINRTEFEKIQLDDQRSFVCDVKALRAHIEALGGNKTYSNLVENFIPTFIKLSV